MERLSCNLLSLRPITVIVQKIEVLFGLPQNRTTAMTTTMTTAQQVLNQIQTECEYGISCSDRIGCLHCQRRAFVLIRGSTKFQAICRGWIERTKKEEEEREYEYSHCGEDKDTGEIIVAGGGMMNGNAYATIKIVDECTVLYREYGKNAWSEVYRNSELEWCDEGYNFDVVPC
jgi:hypothetical protein